MFCPRCGSQNEDNAAFCGNCGNPLPNVSVTDAEATAVPAVASGQDAVAANPGRNTKLIVGIAVIVVVIVALIAGGIVWFNLDQASKAKRAPHSILVTINATGYSDQDTLIPIRATGTDLDGKAVDELFFVNGEGEGVSLSKGAYELKVEASPLTADGVLYKKPDTTFTLVVSDDLEDSVSLDATGDVKVDLEKSTALDETQEMINEAHEAAVKDSAQVDKADKLAEKAQQVHDEAVAAKQREEAERQERERQEEFERNWVRTAQAGLGVPFNSNITYSVSFDGPGSWWQGAGIYTRYISFYEDGEFCAGGACVADTGEPARSLTSYNAREYLH